jgi:hypothetical protein
MTVTDTGTDIDTVTDIDTLTDKVTDIEADAITDERSKVQRQG